MIRRFAPLVLGALLVGAVAAISPPATPPLYDGIGFPDEPYRWVSPPPGAKDPRRTDRWTPALADLRVDNGVSATSMITSREQGPQVGVFMHDGALEVPPGTESVRIEAQAQPNPTDLPPVGRQASNVYRFSATVDGEPIRFKEEQKPQARMRIDWATEKPVVAYWRPADGGTWQQQATFQVGTDIYTFLLPEFGDYVLLELDDADAVSVEVSTPWPVPSGLTYVSPTATPAGPGAQAAGPGGGLSSEPGIMWRGLWIALGSTAIALALLLLGARWLMARRRP